MKRGNTALTIIGVSAIIGLVGWATGSSPAVLEMVGGWFSTACIGLYATGCVVGAFVASGEPTGF